MSNSAPAAPGGPDFERGIAELTKYAAERGTTYPPHDLKVGPDDFKLGRWADSRRRRPPTTRALRQQLEAIPGWSWSTRSRSEDPEEFFASQLASLRSYVADNGRMPSTSYVDPDGFPLGVWVSIRRSQEGKNPGLDRALEQMTGWSWRVGKGATVEQRFAKHLVPLAAYLKAHGKLPPRSYVTPDGIKLGIWVRDRRTRVGRNPDLDAYLRKMPGWRW